MAELKIFSVTGYRSTDIAKHLQVGRQAISTLAHRYQWGLVAVVGRENIYRVQDVAKYLAAHRRSPLLRKLGARFHGLFWESVCDGICPECGGFAVFWNPDLEVSARDSSSCWACENGHISQQKDGE